MYILYLYLYLYFRLVHGAGARRWCTALVLRAGAVSGV
jgi:hypothetical protein